MSRLLFSLLSILLAALVLPAISFAQTTTYSSAVITWPSIRTATRYNIYYKEHAVNTWTYSVIGVGAPATSYTLNELKKGVTYDYKVGAIKIKKEMNFYISSVTVK